MSDPKLTAEQGADKAWLKFQKSDRLFAHDGDEPGYCCENCKHNLFIVQYRLTSGTSLKKFYECTCGKSGIAASVEETKYTKISVQEYILNDDHFIGKKVDERESNDEDTSVEETVWCQACFTQSAAEPNEDPPLPGKFENSPEVRILCEKCKHEIEFGRSIEGDCAEQLWPVEAEDFNPNYCWPEPQYEKSWRRRGWIRE